MHDSGTKDQMGRLEGRYEVSIGLRGKLGFDCALPTGVQDALPDSVFNSRAHLPMVLGGRWREVLTRHLYPSKGTTANLRTLQLLTQNPHPATSSQPWSKAALWGQVYKLMEPPCGPLPMLTRSETPPGPCLPCACKLPTQA